MKEKTFTIIDGYGFLFRAYYVLPHLVTTTGLPIGGVYGFLNMLLKYIAHSDYLTIAFDSGKKNFRHDLYSEYKANRVTPPEDLTPQFAILREAVEAFNLSYEEIEGYEADDIIATLAANYGNTQGFKVVVVSSDKDLFQLLNHNILIFDPIKNIYGTFHVTCDIFFENKIFCSENKIFRSLRCSTIFSISSFLSIL